MPESRPHKDARPRSRWWVLVQHQDVTVLHQDERPDTKPVKGERLKSVHGPYYAEAEARARADLLVSRTHRARADKGRV